MVVSVAKEEYDKEWAEKGITLTFYGPFCGSPAVEFLPQADAWVFRHAGMEFKLLREKGQREFEEMLKMLMNAVATSLGVYPPRPEREQYEQYQDEEDKFIKAIFTRQGKEMTQLVVCKGDDMGPDEMVRGLRLLSCMQ
ncbi:hypothetical protein HXX76_009843 [Chlamydomonas incerta]|uniref:Uncharacterized protein n=1 Tax=Chlamydomonas incerta TaxID=51695 RepID=A0A835SPM5_CHLIN|nr:hypothetical protein HXX76_009843 [Chlamydomonas incerta]|eukprot:KAG2430869.1 hypothetical protein HXX76_009843 [Chlamydomonas incerta]